MAAGRPHRARAAPLLEAGLLGNMAAASPPAPENFPQLDIGAPEEMAKPRANRWNQRGPDRRFVAANPRNQQAEAAPRWNRRGSDVRFVAANPPNQQAAAPLWNQRGPDGRFVARARSKEIGIQEVNQQEEAPEANQRNQQAEALEDQILEPPPEFRDPLPDDDEELWEMVFRLMDRPADEDEEEDEGGDEDADFGCNLQELFREHEEFRILQTDFHDWLQVWRMDVSPQNENVKNIPDFTQNTVEWNAQNILQYEIEQLGGVKPSFGLEVHF